MDEKIENDVESDLFPTSSESDNLKKYYENVYYLCYECAVNYAEQGEFSSTETHLKRALDAVIKLMKMTVGKEQELYKARAEQIVELLKSIRLKMSEANQKHPSSEPIQERPVVEENENKIPLEDSLARIDELTGLSGVKKELSDLVAELHLQFMREEYGIKQFGQSARRPMLFVGGSLTDKIEISKIMTDIFHCLNYTKKRQIAVIRKEDFVGERIDGIHATLCRKIKRALGGVVFVDDVGNYNMKNEKDMVAISSIIKEFFENYWETVFIFSTGNEQEMEEFLMCNPALQSRIPTKIYFD